MVEEAVRQIVIAGYYGFGNIGDEAVLGAIIQVFQSIWPDAPCIVISGDPGQTSQEHGVRALGRRDWRQFLGLLAKKGTIFVSGGGTLLQDVTSSRSLYYYLGLVALCRVFKVPVVVYGQGLGPLERLHNRWLTGWFLKGVKMVIPRDQQAYDGFLRLGSPGRDRLCLGADPVVMLEPMEVKGLSLGEELGLNGDGRVLLVTLRPWPTLNPYLDQLACILDEYGKSGWHVVFLPFQHSVDYPVCRDVALRMAQPAHVWGRPLGFKEALWLMGQVDLCLGMRLHALIFASIWGIPIVGLSYDPKVEGFLEDLGLERFAVGLSLRGTPDPVGQLAKAMEKAAKDGTSLRKQVVAGRESLKKRMIRASDVMSKSWTRQERY